MVTHVGDPSGERGGNPRLTLAAEEAVVVQNPPAPHSNMADPAKRALIVSHPCVLTVNQQVYARLSDLGWEIDLVVPARWSHDYAAEPFTPEPLPDLAANFFPLPVVFEGRPQRHFYLRNVAKLLDRRRPSVAFVEEESFALSSLQWGRALHRRTIPFGIQSDENLDRHFPAPVVLARNHVLDRAAFVAARSPRAAELATRWGARGKVTVIPHAIPAWDLPLRQPRPFTVGFAGRLVPEKGIDDLVAAVAAIGTSCRLLFVGDGPMRERLQGLCIPDALVEVWTDWKHEDMPRAFAEMDVLVLPSRTTERWAEQFGRVLVEALLSGTPVIGSDSGAIPWVLSSTQGGCQCPEGDSAALARAIRDLMHDPDRRRTLADTGRANVLSQFTDTAVARTLDHLFAELIQPR